MSCQSNCNSCSSTNDCEIHVEGSCPVCGKPGIDVPNETVKNLVKPFYTEQISEDLDFKLCISRPCKVAYYSGEAVIYKDQIKVPIWFKHEANPYMVCYCKEITLEDIINAVNNMDEEINQKSVVRYLNKENINSDCKKENPTGKCCSQLFENAINYALKKKQ